MITETTAADLAVARELHHDDDYADARTLSINLHPGAAHELLSRLGWHRDARQRWVAPDGSWYWETDEALTLALTAATGPDAGA